MVTPFPDTEVTLSWPPSCFVEFLSKEITPDKQYGLPGGWYSMCVLGEKKMQAVDRE